MAEHKGRTGGPSGRDFALSRVFQAPRHLVYRAWVEPECLKQWWGPKGFEMHSCTFDLRPGGKFHYGMRLPSGQEMWGTLLFREIVPPERLVFVASFSDRRGGITRHPMSQEWPLEVLSTVTFSQEKGKTTLTMSARPIEATDPERKAFESGFESMRTGWAGSLTQLEEYLTRGGA